MEISRARRLGASASLLAGAGSLGWVAVREALSGWTDPYLFGFIGLVVAAGVGLSRRSLVAQVFSRGLAWLMFVPTAMVTVAELVARHSPDRLAWFVAATSGIALLAGRPMLHTAQAQSAFAPVRFRRVFLAGATAASSVALATGMAAIDSFRWHDDWSGILHGTTAGIGLATLAASLFASAAATVRMRGWGVLLGAATSMVMLLAAAFYHDIVGLALAAAAVPGLVLALPILASRLGAPASTTPPVRISLAATEPAAITRTRVAEDDVDDLAYEHPDHAEHATDHAPRARAQLG
jgi:hypothetical protein